MTFLYPLGLLGLIGIPILIIIYIIKSKYTEQTVSSTYLWTLSEKFLKRRNPLSKLTGIISLILQLLAVTVISLAIAHPVIILPDAAEEYCFILDGSGSMRMESDGVTRFEKGKAHIKEVISESVNGSVFTLVYAGDNTNIVYERMEDTEKALLLLDELEPDYGETYLTDAVGVAQRLFNENSGIEAYLVTDSSYQKNENITLVDVSAEEKNYAISDVSYFHGGDGKLTVSGNVVSYSGDTSLGMELYIDDAKVANAKNTVVVKNGEETTFQLSCMSGNFSSLRVVITKEDALSLDNEYIVYDIESENSYNTLIVSDRPFFFESAMKAMINAKVDVISPEDYLGESGYGLYVFDSYSPETLPRDGSVWLINPDGSVSDAGFSVRSEVTFSKAEPIEITDSTASSVKTLTKDISGDDIYLLRYVKCGLYRNFTTLYSYQGNPVVFAGTNAYGNREVVFAFDLHDSNLPLLLDYAILLRNLVEYSFPEMIEKTTYNCGDEVNINVLANCDSIRIDSPSGEVSYLGTDSATARLVLDEVGVYTVTMTVADSQRVFNIYSAMTLEERVPSVELEELSLRGEASEEGLDGKYDPMMILFIALAVIFFADWMVYCYEKYQLR